jgi:hypothetical protein
MPKEASMALITRLFVTLACLSGLTSLASAEQSQDFGPYVVHYSAITSDTLLPEVARQYGITRSKNRAVLTMTVLKKVMSTTGTPTSATITGNATSLSAQMRTLDFRAITEGNAIYYISEFPVADRETLDFNLQVVPAGETQPLAVRFRQQFFTEGKGVFHSQESTQ